MLDDSMGIQNASLDLLFIRRLSDREAAGPTLVIGPYPSYSMGPMEILLIVLLFVVWFYALRRFYTVWSNVLNFSAISADSFGTRQTRGKSSPKPERTLI